MIANYNGVMIGIDPGTKIIGVAIVKDRNPIFCGRIKSNGKTVIERLGDIGNQVLRQNFFGLANLKNDGTFQFLGRGRLRGRATLCCRCDRDRRRVRRGDAGRGQRGKSDCGDTH